MKLPAIESQITFLYARDLAASARFYEDLLGFELALDQGACRIYRVAGSEAYLGICQSDAEAETRSLIFTLVTPAVEAWHRRIEAAGWQCEHAPRYNPDYAITHFFLRDPDGYRIEIQRFESGHWAGKAAAD